MKILIGAVAARGRNDAFDSLGSLYLERIAAYSPVESSVFRSEEAFFQQMEKLRARTSPFVVLLDSRGKLMSSEEMARWIGRQREADTQNLVFAIGPADGWTDAARSKARLLLSFGPMTLPHELARVVLVEQVYRAFTILAGHPYHGGH